MMHMTFYWGKTVTLLFDEWFVSSWLGYVLSLVVVFLAGVFHEWFASRRACFSSAVENKASKYHSSHGEHGHHVPLLGHVRAPSASQAQKVSEALLYTISTGLGYLLMLAVMSYNGGVFLAIVLGLGFGYYLFRAGTDSRLPAEACALA